LIGLNEVLGSKSYSRSNSYYEVTTVIKPKPPTLKSVVQTALAAPVRAFDKLASLFRGKKQLRIVK
jgi:hypothetical protein